ncbi:MAG: glycosyl transferase [Rhodospirillaceae bacterium]|nr:glycosyl transferase [Rhodospirillaceae bacterium]
MKLLQAIAGARYGGAEAFFTRLAVALHHAGQEQRVIMRRHPDRANALRRGGVEPMELAFGGLFDVATRWRLAAEVRDYSPDVVLTWMNRATSKMPSGPFVHAARLGGYYDLKYYRRCDYLIGNTPGIVEYLINSGWPSERTRYIPNFVNTAKGVPINRAALETPDDARVILAMGRLHNNKAFDVLIQALSAVSDAVLWLAGDGPLATDLRTLAEEMGVSARVRFLGWRDDAADLIASADVLACPSRLEPLGNVVIEAWSQAKPVVASSSLGPAHLIDDGETGLLVPIDDVKQFAAALVRVLDERDLAGRLGRAGQACYETNFTEQKVVDQYLDFFAWIMA